MGVYIKGMEMPTRCFDCPFMEYSGACGNHCSLTGEFNGDIDLEEVRREEHCPLIELPPHGRLIDADELMLKVKDFPYGYRGMIAAEIANAPTIIESEEEDDKS